MGLSRRQFTKEFKLAAVRRLEQGVSIAEAARALEVSARADQFGLARRRAIHGFGSRTTIPILSVFRSAVRPGNIAMLTRNLSLSAPTEPTGRRSQSSART